MEKPETIDFAASPSSIRIGKKKNYFDQKYSGEEEDLGTFLCFEIADYPFIIPIRLSGEIVKEFFIAKIPTAPKHILGLTNIRGTLLPVADIVTLLGKDEKSEPKYLMVIDFDKWRICLALPQLPETHMLPISKADYENFAENTLNKIDLVSFPYKEKIFTVLNIPLLFSKNYLLQ